MEKSEPVESRADFIQKLTIDQKEANEAEYRIELLFKSEYIDFVKYELIISKISEIKKNLSSILISSQFNKSKQ